MALHTPKADGKKRKSRAKPTDRGETHEIHADFPHDDLDDDTGLGHPRGAGAGAATAHPRVLHVSSTGVHADFPHDDDDDDDNDDRFDGDHAPTTMTSTATSAPRVSSRDMGTAPMTPLRFALPIPPPPDYGSETAEQPTAASGAADGDDLEAMVSSFILEHCSDSEYKQLDSCIFF